MKLNYSSGSNDIRINAYLIDPRSMSDLGRLRDRDRQAVHDIERLTEAIEKIRAHRLDLMERAQFLATAAPAVSVELHRHKSYRGSVTYTLEVVHTLPDDTRKVESKTTFTGKERSAAIKAYKELCRAHPGAAYVLDIEKGKWER